MAVLISVSFDRNALKALRSDGISRMIAAAMLGFDVDFLSRLPALSASVYKAFGNVGILGDYIVEFPIEPLLRMIVGALREENSYRALGSGAVEMYEWRLRRYLLKLR